MTERMESPLERALQFAGVGFLAGVGAAAGVGGALWLLGGTFQPGVFIGFPVGGFVGGFFAAFVFQESVGGLFFRATQGTRGTSPTEFSDAQALAIRGLHRKALERYRQYADERPRDPRPLILGARLLRDDLSDYGAAVAWLQEAQRREPLDAEAGITIGRELVELFEERLGDPSRALPELARMADRYRGSRAGDWAARRLAELRTRAWSVVREEEESEPLTDYQRRVTGRGGDGPDTGGVPPAG